MLRDNKGQFLRGMTPWNKGKKTGLVPRTAFKKGVHYSRVTEFKKGENIGQNNHTWKGERVSYRALHSWVERHLGKPNKCACSHRGDCSKKLSWANISHEYKRSLLDWLPMCYRHHKLYDLAHKKENVYV